MRGRIVWAVGVVGCVLAMVACGTGVPATNSLDPSGNGPKEPGRITARVFVQGSAEQSGWQIQIFDAAEVRVDDGVATSSDGTFLSPALRPGKYRLLVDPRIENLAIERIGIEVLPGVTTDLGLLTSFAEPEIGQIAGQVLLEDDDTGASLAGSRVVLTRLSSTFNETREARTDAGGTFTFTQLPPGDYELHAQREGFTPAISEWQISPARALNGPDPMLLYPASAVMRFAVSGPAGDILGAPYTRIADIDLVMLAFGGVNEMRFSESADFREAGVVVPWREYIAQVPVSLSTRQGRKTIYAQFRVWDPEPAESPRGERLRTETYSAHIVYDATPPVALSFELAPDALEVGRRRYLTAGSDPSSVPVEVIALDTYSSVAGIKLVVEDADPATVPYVNITSEIGTITWFTTVALSPTDGTKQVQLQLLDGAGNESALMSASVVIDTLPPALLDAQPIKVRGAIAGELYSTTSTLQFLVGSDSGTGADGPVQMRFGLAPLASTGTEIAFLPEVTTVVNAQHDDSVQFEGIFTDAAGNSVTAYSDTYILKLLGSIAGTIEVEGFPEGEWAGTTVYVFASDADTSNSGAAIANASTSTTGAYAISGLPAGSYQVKIVRSGAASVVRSPVQVAAGRPTQLGSDRLVLERGGLHGLFSFGDVGQGGNHSGIAVLIESVAGGSASAITVSTDTTGAWSASGLTVGDYRVSGGVAGYVGVTVGGTVARDVSTAVNPDTAAALPYPPLPVALPKLSGDFKICDVTDPAPLAKDCTAVLYTSSAQVLLGLSAENVTHVRYILQDPANLGADSFSIPGAPVTTECATPPQADCWNPYDPAEAYTVAIDGQGEGRATVLVQFAVSGDIQPVGTAQIVYDVTPPLTPAVTIERGAQALIDGYTNVLELAVDFTAVATTGPSTDAAPLATVGLSRDAVLDIGVGGDAEFVYGGTKLFTIASVDGIKEVFAWGCDAAGNCASAPVSDTIILDQLGPARGMGREIVPSGTGITDKSVGSRQWWSRALSSGMDIDVGRSDFALPEVAAYRVSLSEQFVGAEWVTLDLAQVAADDIITVRGLDLPPVDGEHVIWSQFMDVAGNISTAEMGLDKLSIFLDTTPPGGTITLEGGAAYTKKTTLDVVLLSDAVGGASHIQYSWTGILPGPGDLKSAASCDLPATGCLYATLLQMAPQKDDGSGGRIADADDGSKLLVVRFFDAAGNFAERSARIFVDTTPPDPATASASCESCTYDDAANAYYRDLTGEVALNMFAADNSGIIDHVEVSVDAGPTQNIQYAPLQTLAVATTAGPHTVTIVYVDPAGNSTTVPLLSMIYDKTAPTLSVEVDSNAVWTNTDRVVVTVTGTDVNPIVSMEVSNSATLNGASTTPFTNSVAWALDAPSADDVKTVYVRVTDAAGNATTASDSISYDATAPTLSAILSGDAAGGAGTVVTRNSSVTVQLTGADAGGLPSGLDGLRVSNSQDFAGASWVSYPASNAVSGHALAEPTVEGPKVVYVQARDLAGNVVDAQATIQLDTAAPTGNLAINDGAAFTQGRNVVLNMTASSDVETMFVATGASIDCGLTASYIPFNAAAPLLLPDSDALTTVRVCLQDAAGRVVELSDTITLDRTGPVSSSITIDGGAAETASTAVSLTVGATDTPAGVSEFKLSDGAGCVGGSWQAFDDGDADDFVTTAWNISAGNRVSRTVSVRFKDAAGHLSAACGSDAILIDTAGPDSALISIAPGAAASVVGVTNSEAVQLSLFAQGADSYQVDLDPAQLLFANGVTAMAAASVSVAFCIEGGTPPTCTALPASTSEARTVYARFYDALGNPSTIVQATVFVDNTPPSGEGLTIPVIGAVTSVAPDLFSRSEILTVQPAAASDAGLQMRLRTDGAFDSEPWLDFAPTTSVVLSTASCPAMLCTVWAEYKDSAGNLVSPVSAQIILDQTPPVAPRTAVVETVVQSTAYTLQIVPGVVSDTNFLRFEIQGGQYATFAASVSDLENVLVTETNFAMTLVENSTNTLRIRAVDKAGNVSGDDFTLAVHDDLAPARPSGLEVEVHDSELKLSWNSRDLDDVQFFRVYYGTVSELYNGTTAQQGASPIEVGRNTSFNLTGLSNGNRVYLTVTAVDAAGNESGQPAAVVGIPSQIAPQLLSQVGGRISRIWANDAAGLFFVPRDGGLHIVSESAGALGDVGDIPNIPDPTQVLFDNTNGYIFVHSADPNLGPVDTAPPDPIFDGLPNPEAPVRTLTTFNAATLAQVATLQLPDKTMFFDFFDKDGVQRGVSAVNGFEVRGDATDGPPKAIVLTATELSWWAYDSTKGVFSLESASTTEPVTAFGRSKDSELLLGAYPPGTYTIEQFFAAEPRLRILDVFGATPGTQIATTTFKIASDSMVLLVGELQNALDYLMTPSVSDGFGNALPVVDLSDTSNPVAHGDLSPDGGGDPMPFTASNGGTDFVEIDDPSTADFGMALNTPALVGHVINFVAPGLNAGRTATIIAHQQILGDTLLRYDFSPALPDPVLPLDGIEVVLDETPLQQSVRISGFPEPDDIQTRTLAADPTQRRIYVTVEDNGGGPKDPDETRTLKAYDIALTPTSETATAAGLRIFPQDIVRVQVFPSYLVVLTAGQAHILPKATWDTAPGVDLPLDSSFSQLIVHDGMLYASARSASGPGRFSVIDVSNPRQLSTKGFVTTLGPVLKFSADANRLNVLQGECSYCPDEFQWDAPWIDGFRNCACSNQALQTFTLSAGDLSADAFSAPSATRATPNLLNQVNPLPRAGYDDMLSVGADLWLWASTDDGSAQAHLERRVGQELNAAAGTLKAGGDYTLDASSAGQEFSLAVSGQYLFLGAGSSGAAGGLKGQGVTAHRVTAAGLVQGVGESDGVLTQIYSMDIVDTRLFAIAHEALVIYDIESVLAGDNDDATQDYSLTGPNIVEVARYDPVLTAQGGVISGAYAYIMTRTGVHIVDITVPEIPRLVYELQTEPRAIAIDGGILYIATVLDGIRIYELTRLNALRVGPTHGLAGGTVQYMEPGRNQLTSALFAAPRDIVVWSPTTTDSGLTTSPAHHFKDVHAGDQFRKGFSDHALWTYGPCGAANDSCLSLFDMSYGGMPSAPAATNPPITCTNDLLDGDESDIDCGGSCEPCVGGRICAMSTDCLYGECAGLLCQPPILDQRASRLLNPFSVELPPILPFKEGTTCTSQSDCCAYQMCNEIMFPEHCSNGMADFGETDIDCGGPCSKCADGAPCLLSSDCRSQNCDGTLTCAAPIGTCSDGIFNGDETATDCGGSCSYCAPGAACLVDDDCETTGCVGNFCGTPRACFSDRGFVASMARGPSTENFVVVKSYQHGEGSPYGPNDGIYVVSHSGVVGDSLVLRDPLVSGALAGASAGACAPAEPNISNIYEVAWTRGFLFAGGAGLSVMRAEHPESADYLDWGNSDPNIFNAVDDGPNELCILGLEVQGNYLYAMGTLRDAKSPDCDAWGGGSERVRGGYALWVYDISNPMAPDRKGYIDLERMGSNGSAMASDFKVHGNHVLMLASEEGRIFMADISNPALPVITGAFDVLGSNIAIEIMGTHIYVNGGSMGIRTIDGR